MMKKIIIGLMLICGLLLFACKKEVEESKYDVYYIEQYLDATKYIKYTLNKSITTDEFVLLNETTTVTKEKDVYKIEKHTKKLANIEAEQQYIETSETKLMKTIENPIKLNFHDKYFSSTTISEFYFQGNVYEEFANELIGIDNINNIVLEIKLSNNFEVTNIKICYVDIETTFDVVIEVTYEY